MEARDVALKIDALCDELEKQEKRIAKFAKSEKLAIAEANYDKSIELAMATLEHEGVPVTTMKDKAKGICSEQLRELRSLEIKWRAMLSIHKSTEGRLIAQQSIHKNFSII